MAVHLLQLQRGDERRVALVAEPHLVLLQFRTLYDLVSESAAPGMPIEERIRVARMDARLVYDPIYAGTSEWKIISPIDHPEPARLHISGTGLTHLGSAKNRNAMHVVEKSEAGGQKSEDTIENRKSKSEKPETDSMKIFRWGIERGKPAEGQIGVAPEWFHKGNGTLLRAHNQALDWPAHAEDGGEEAEIVGIYLIDAQGNPVRIGMTQGNEFSDHVFEKKNYLNLAGSKLRTSSLGPELVLNPNFAGSIPGAARILRDAAGTDTVVWSKPLATGEEEMCHSLANIEHHHFKFDNHRRPGDVHVHFFGTCALSYADGIRLQNDDIMEVHYEGFGRPLRNPIRIARASDAPVTVKPLA